MKRIMYAIFTKNNKTPNLLGLTRKSVEWGLEFGGKLVKITASWDFKKDIIKKSKI